MFTSHCTLHVICHVSCVTCHVSNIMSPVHLFLLLSFLFFFSLTKWRSLSVEGLLSTGPTTSSYLRFSIYGIEKFWYLVVLVFLTFNVFIFFFVFLVSGFNANMYLIIMFKTAIIVKLKNCDLPIFCQWCEVKTLEYFDQKSLNSLKIFKTLVQKMPLSHPLISYKKNKKNTSDLRQNRLKDKFVLINA